jgi:hypothetical protein
MENKEKDYSSFLFRIPTIIDPKTKQPSVSLTNLVISILLLITNLVLNMILDKKVSSEILDYFYASCMLYFGRRFNIPFLNKRNMDNNIINQGENNENKK